MISHRYRCILIHIPRTAGSSIERWIHGSDWWDHSPSTKHLLASQAKQLYHECWDDYFKFAFVRNPWDRMVSCLHHSLHFRLDAGNDSTRYARDRRQGIELSGYKKLFGYPVTVEHDHRFFDRSDLIRDEHKANCVYQNIIDEPIDFIGCFETLAADVEYLRKRLGIKRPFRFHQQKSRRKAYQHYFDERSREEIGQLYAEDIEAFGYEFEESYASSDHLKCA